MDRRIRPNWYVITGAPSSGKTTTLKLLEEKGYRVIYEMARIYIDEELKKGKTLTQIRGDEAAFQREVLRRKIDLEKTLNPQELYFFERGIPDSAAYYELIGVDHDRLLKEALRDARYKRIFLLELISFQSDYARTENAQTARKIGSLLEKYYNTETHSLVKVPKMSIEERVQYILEHL